MPSIVTVLAEPGVKAVVFIVIELSEASMKPVFMSMLETGLNVAPPTVLVATGAPFRLRVADVAKPPARNARGQSLQMELELRR